MIRLFGECWFAPCSQTDQLWVKHGLDTLYHGVLYRESFAPNCWMTRGEPVPFRLSHDGLTVGETLAIIDHRGWHIADFVVELHEDDALLPVVRERVVPGARVSLGFRSIRRDEDEDLRLVRHNLCFLDEVALLADGDVAGRIGARITSVREAKTEKPKTASGGWRGSVRAGWESLLENGFEPHEGLELLIGKTLRASHRFDGQRFVPVGRRVAA